MSDVLTVTQRIFELDIHLCSDSCFVYIASSRSNGIHPPLEKRNCHLLIRSFALEASTKTDFRLCENNDLCRFSCFIDTWS